MPLTLVHDCPACQAKNSAFSLTNEARQIGETGDWVLPRFHATFSCNTCRMPTLVLFSLLSEKGDASYWHGDLAKNKFFFIIAFHPKALSTDLPSHLDDAVAESFSSGCEILKIAPVAATLEFRRTLEILLKQIDPESKDRSLYERIERVIKNDVVAGSLREWAHLLRTNGNSAAHGEVIDRATAERIAAETQELTKYLLIYLCSLPKQVALARERSVQ